MAPDWTADWLHREAVWILDRWAADEGAHGYDALTSERQAALRARLHIELRTNTYDPEGGRVTVSPIRASALRSVQAHYVALFGSDPQVDALRESYAMPRETIRDAQRRHALTAFLFWAAWSCVTERPEQDITYTHNWPPDDLIGNRPTGAMIVVSVASVVLLLGGIGALVWFYAATRDTWRSDMGAPLDDPLQNVEPTPSMLATQKYFWVVGGLLVVQMAAGVVSAHYGVEGTGFYGIPLSAYVPYSLARTWHVQLGILWIATSWLATGLCLVPLIAEREPRFQRIGVNLLLAALVLVVGGSMAGQTLAIHQQLDDTTNFWFGHQGYEYLDLGRVWQALLFVGLLLWLALMLRPLLPAWRPPQQGPLCVDRRHRRVMSIDACGPSTATALLRSAPSSVTVSEPSSPAGDLRRRSPRRRPDSAGGALLGLAGEEAGCPRPPCRGFRSPQVRMAVDQGPAAHVPHARQ